MLYHPWVSKTSVQSTPCAAPHLAWAMGGGGGGGERIVHEQCLTSLSFQTWRRASLRTLLHFPNMSTCFTSFLSSAMILTMHIQTWRVSSQNGLTPFWSIWDIWDLSCWNIKKIIRKSVILLIITSKIFLIYTERQRNLSLLQSDTH